MNPHGYPSNREQRAGVAALKTTPVHHTHTAGIVKLNIQNSSDRGIYK
jgi:hypothetical protein